MRRQLRVHVIGGGLAGCEAALQLARCGVAVKLYEQRPRHGSPAHTGDGLAELVCSNSLRSAQLSNAVGLLKEELRRLGSGVMAAADETCVPAGGALAVDRIAFSAAVEARLASSGVRVSRQRVDHLPRRPRPTILATGPLTEGALAADLATLTGARSLHFYDAIAPILETDSIDRGQVFAASRYGRGDPEDYLNVPLNAEQYHAFVARLLEAPKVTPHDFESSACFEGCMPIEDIAARGLESLAFGPMKPVGLVDPRTGKRPYAVVQLRKEDRADTARNLVGFQTRLTHGAQREILRGLPGLEGARFLRLGSVHRNSFLDAPQVLDDDLRLRGLAHVWVAGQLSGSEGYVEAIAVGLLAGRSLAAQRRGEAFVPPPPETALGGLYRHLRQSRHEGYAPSNVTWAMVAPSAALRGGRRQRREAMAQRALAAIILWGENIAP